MSHPTFEPLESRRLFHAQPAIYIDAGGGPYTDPGADVTYAKDHGFFGGASGTQPFDVKSTSRDAMYVTRRWGKDFGYHLPVQNGEYHLKLLFVEPAWNGNGQRKFDAWSEGRQILNDFDIHAAAGFRTATSRTFDVTVRDGALNVWFIAAVDNAIVSGIEITPVHDDSPPPPPVDNGTIKWAKAAANPQARFEGQGAVVNGKLYVFGGFYNEAVQATRRSDVYDPATNRWTRIKDMPEPLTHAGVAVDGNTVYIIGGYNGDHPSPATNHVWKYNTATNTWSAGPSLPDHRGAGAAAKVGRSIHFFAGTNKSRIDKNHHWVLNLDTGRWSSRASYPVAASHLAAVELNGKIYGMGGERNLNESSGNLSDVYRYDPSTDKWTKLASLPVARSHFSSSLFARNGRLIAIGGTGNGGTNGVPRNDVTEYNPSTNKWRVLTSLPMALKTPVAALINGKIIATTGNASGGAVPVSSTWIGTVA